MGKKQIDTVEVLLSQMDQGFLDFLGALADAIDKGKRLGLSDETAAAVGQFVHVMLKPE